MTVGPGNSAALFVSGGIAAQNRHYITLILFALWGIAAPLNNYSLSFGALQHYIIFWGSFELLFTYIRLGGAWICFQSHDYSLQHSVISLWESVRIFLESEFGLGIGTLLESEFFGDQYYF